MNDEAAILSWSPSAADTVLLLLEDFAPSPGLKDPSSRLRAAGAWLADLASLETDEFSDLLKERFIPHLSAYLGTLEGLLSAYSGEPAEWAEDVERMIAFIEGHVTEPAFFLPIELVRETGPETAAERFRVLLSSYGRLLGVWPEIHAAAAKINGSGRRFARSVT